MSRYIDPRTESNENITREKQQKIRTMFNNISHRYDFLNHFFSLGIDKSWRKKTIHRMKIDNHAVILDLATGTGDLARTASRKNPQLIIGVDPARGMLSQTAKKIQKSFFAVEAFAENLPLKSSVFSHAMIAYGIRNVSDRAQALAEVYRVLKPGGVFAILEFATPRNKIFSSIFNFYFHKVMSSIGGLLSGDRDAYSYLPESVDRFVTPEELSDEARRAGFEPVKIERYFFGVTALCIVKKP